MALGAETITDVRPFRALHFDPARVDLATVVTPPMHEQSAMIITNPSTPLTVARNWRSVSHRS